MHDFDWESGTFGVLSRNPSSGTAPVIGMGFAVEHGGKNLLITCRHVIVKYANTKEPENCRDLTVPIVFPGQIGAPLFARLYKGSTTSHEGIQQSSIEAAGGKYSAKATASEIDIAVMEFCDDHKIPAPSGITTLPVGSSNSRENSIIRSAYIYPEQEQYHVTVFDGQKKADVPTLSRFVVQSSSFRRGFSGAPIWDSQRECVIGIYSNKFPVHETLGVNFDGLAFVSECLEDVIPSFRVQKLDGELTVYLSQFRDFCQDLNLPLDISEELNSNMEEEPGLSKIFVAPRLQELAGNNMMAERLKRLIREGTEQAEAGRSINQSLSVNRDVIIVGAALRGKTTLLKHYGLMSWDAPETVGLTKRHLPIFLSFSEISEFATRDLTQSIDRAIRAGRASSFEGELEFNREKFSIENWSKRCGAPILVLLDGFDEIPAIERDKIKKKIFPIWTKHKPNWIGRIVITSRPIKELNNEFIMKNLCVYEIKEFPLLASLKLAENWLGQSALSFISQWRTIRPGMSTFNAGLLTISCSSFQPGGKKLPDNSVEIYDRFVDNRLDKIYEANESTSTGDMEILENRGIITCLAVLAYQTIIVESGARIGFDKNEFLERFRAIAGEIKIDHLSLQRVRRLLADIGTTTGFFSFDVKDERTTWAHLSFRDFFVGKYLIMTYRKPNRALSVHLDKWRHSTHRASIIFFLCQISQSQKDISPYLKSMFPNILKTSDQANNFLISCLREGVKLPDALQQRLFKWLSSSIARYDDDYSRSSCAAVLTYFEGSPIDTLRQIAHRPYAQEIIIDTIFGRSLRTRTVREGIEILADIDRLDLLFDRLGAQEKKHSRLAQSSPKKNQIRTSNGKCTQSQIEEMVVDVLIKMESSGWPLSVDVNNLPERIREIYRLNNNTDDAGAPFIDRTSNEMEIILQLSKLVRFAEQELGQVTEWDAFLVWLSGEYSNLENAEERLFEYLKTARYRGPQALF